MAVTAFAVACTSSSHPSANGSRSTVVPSSPASKDIKGAHVRVLGMWSGPELDNFMTVKSAWEHDTGATVDWEATQDQAGGPDASVPASGQPDVAIVSNLEVMQQLAADNKLVPLNDVLDMKQIDHDYPQAWRDLGSHDGKLFGIFYKVTDKATVWYSPKAFAADSYSVPTTWRDMMALADKMVTDGHVPFSVVAANGPANGWALTDWISEIVLNNCGPDVYDKWVAGQIPWTDACVKQSFGLFLDVVQKKGYVLGGAQRIVSTGDDHGADPLYSNPPGAYMYYLASFTQGFVAANFPTLAAGTDYGFFPFPSINPQYSGSDVVGADIVVMMKNTPAAKSFMQYLAGAKAQEAWIKLGGFTSVNRSVSPDAYPDPVARAIAADLTDAKVIRFSAGDVMPADLQRAWWAAMLELLGDPTKLDGVLTSLTSAAQSTS